MEDDVSKASAVGTSDDIDSRCAVNSLILDYYKKFGRKRDLEQYFSLSTAQSDIKDTSGLFWRKMKSENDSSDSGGRKSDSSQEVCRISIRCSLPEPSSSQDDDPKTKTDSTHTESPPIIIEEVPADVSRHTDEESINFDDNHSQKSFDALLDLSAHKPLSPTSSITSQRKLEWDSLADVGYANETDRKTSASSLSTLERLALKQQYSNNDSKQDIGQPTSHSTPVDENESKSRVKKGVGKKTTKIYKKDVDFVELNVPHASDTNQSPSISVNLTKHISFNVEKGGEITIDNVKSDVNVSPEKVSVEIETIPQLGMDKEIQTSLTYDKSLNKEKCRTLDDTPKPNLSIQKIPVMISLNTLRKRLRKRKSRVIRRRLKNKKKIEANKDVTPQEKSGEQLSEAESFEYMPGHMYNQNQVKDNEPRPDNSTAGNKSSLESSDPLNTDSSKDSKHSLTKDLEKCFDLLRVTLQQRYDDQSVKKRLIKDIVHRLVNSRYRDDDSTTDFLSGLSFNSKKFETKGNNTTTSTSDANNTEDSKQKRPRKSILRTEKFNANVVASTSQSAPNLFTASSEKFNTNLIKTHTVNTESDASSKEKSSSENAFPKTSSEELYLKYLEALRREEAYKRHLKDKEMFLKQKLVSSETAFKVPTRQAPKISNRLKDLMKDLTRNNYDDGSGDASKLEGASTTNMDFDRFSSVRNQRSHSVFTLSSSHSECPKRTNLKKKLQAERELGEAGPSQNHYCCCPHHHINSKVGYADSSVQVNIKYQCEDGGSNGKPCQPKLNTCPLMPNDCKKCKPESLKNTTRVVPDNVTGEIKYVCLCNGKPISSTDAGDNFMIYKCSRLTNRGVQLDDPSRLYNTGVQCGYTVQPIIADDNIEMIQPPCALNTGTFSGSSSDNTSKARMYSRSSQTNMLIKMMCSGNIENNYSSVSEAKNLCGTSTKVLDPAEGKKVQTVHEATRSLQTEISINPRIADPTLSDISIVNDHDCAKLIAEQVRQVSNNSSEKSGNRKTYSDGFTSSLSDKLLVPSENIALREGKTSSKMSSDALKEVLNGQSTVVVGKNYTVPIQGTDMNLMVNLGAMKVTKKREQIHQAITTDKPDYADEATSVIKECSKSAQCQCSVDHNSNKIETKDSNDSPRKTYLSQNYVPAITPKSNTYPKNDPVKERPPFKRSNTDTNTLSVCMCVQTETMPKIDAFNNHQQDNISENHPIPNITTCENACQVVRIEENEIPFVTVPAPNKEFKDMTRSGILRQEHSKTIPIKDKKDVEIQKSDDETKSFMDKGFKPYVVENLPRITSRSIGCETETEKEPTIEKGSCTACQTDVQEEEKVRHEEKNVLRSTLPSEQVNPTEEVQQEPRLDEEKSKSPCCSKVSSPQNPIVNMIQDITRRYSKKDTGKIKKKKCITEIMTVLNYLLDTEDSTDVEPKICCSTSTDTKSSSDKSKKHKIYEGDGGSDKLVDKSIQLSCKKSCKDSRKATESSDLPCSSDLPTTSTDSAACKVLKKIKKECEKYHQKRCKGRKCEVSSSTSVNCENCKKVHHCLCRNHKCKRSKTFEKLQKKCVAYNLIIQTSESMQSEDTVCEKKCRPLQNIIVKVPKRKDNKKEATYKTESPYCSPRYCKNRSKSCPIESESTDEYARKTQQTTVREYLEHNRPDFVEKTSQRQHCMKFISERRASERAAQRDLLSLHLEQQPDLTTLNSDDLRKLAQQIGLDLRRKKSVPKFISEREMKKHSEKIYKTLPEVVQKKEEKKKENIKRTNLLMANIFKKNLQKQTLRGSVNLSNYSTVIKI